MRRVRTTLAVIFGTLALIGMVGSITAIWARNTVFDDSRVAAAVGEALQEPEVTDALATRITAEVMAAVQFEEFLDTVLPEQLQPLAPALVGGVTNVVHDRVSNRLDDPETQAVIVTIVERAHRAFLDLLQGEGLMDGVTVDNGEVTVNFLPLVTNGLQAVQDLGYLTGVDIPEFTADGDPDEQIAELSSALDRPLPDTFGQVVVYRSESLADAGATVETAQRALVVARRAMYLLMALTVAFAIASILCARNRMRAMIVLVVVGALLFVVERAAVSKVLAELPDIFVLPGARTAVRVTSRELASGLLSTSAILAILGLAVAVLLGLFDSNGRLRKRVAERTGDASLGATAAAYRTWIAGIAIGSALLILLVAGLGWFTALLALVLGGVAAAAWLAKPASPGAGDVAATG